MTLFSCCGAPLHVDLDPDTLQSFGLDYSFPLISMFSKNPEYFHKIIIVLES